MDVTEAPVSGDAVVEALIGGPMWAGTDLTFSFPATAAQFTGYAAGSEPFNHFAAFNAAQQAAVRTILEPLRHLGSALEYVHDDWLQNLLVSASLGGFRR